MYNFDEKGFLMGICRSMKRIVSIRHIKSKKILGVNQDGNREFISLLACICADGTAIPPALIYQGESGDLQDVWLEDFDSSSELAYFGVSKKGWTNEELGMSWLTKVFDHNTKGKTAGGRARRLLIVDGHSSHLNLKFIDYCDKNRIILAVLPPHSTHRLQPLDVGVFSPLANAYSNGIDELMHSSFGFSRITKRIFWSIFRAAWSKALTKENIKSAFESTGIHPIDSQKVLSQVGRRTPSPISSDSEPEETTPMSVRGVRRAVKAVGREHKVLDPKISKLIKATERLVIRNEILEHNNKNLNQALCTEKKRRKRGKPMGLVDKDNPGEAQFFSPSKVASARQRALEIDQEKEQQQAEAAQRRLEKQIQREEKARELKERKEERLRAREMKRQEQETRKREKEEERQKKKADKQLSREQQAKEKRGNTRKRQEKGNQTVETESSPTRPEPRVTASGRKIRPPGRYLD
jgi:hypothetical protein